MNLRLAALTVILPRTLRDEKLRTLFRVTAEAFRSPVPEMGGLSYPDKLRSYALFTREEVQKLTTNEERESVKKRLFEGARRLGGELREQLRITSFKEGMSAVRLLYRALGIDFRGEASGEVTIGHCYFEKFYSGDTCRLISSLDDGLISGLSGGGRLSFTERITEGHPCCMAAIHFCSEENEKGDRSRQRSRRRDGG